MLRVGNAVHLVDLEHVDAGRFKLLVTPIQP